MEFNAVIDDTIKNIQDVLKQKANEYASEKSRFHNFEVAGRKLNVTPEKALLGMMIKHEVSVEDMVEWADQHPEKLSIGLINEKIGDNINYLILLKGLLINRVESLPKD
jgi:hypothetical protein